MIFDLTIQNTINLLENQGLNKNSFSEPTTFNWQFFTRCHYVWLLTGRFFLAEWSPHQLKNFFLSDYNYFFISRAKWLTQRYASHFQDHLKNAKNESEGGKARNFYFLILNNFVAWTPRWTFLTFSRKTLFHVLTKGILIVCDIIVTFLWIWLVTKLAISPSTIKSKNHTSSYSRDTKRSCCYWKW